MQSNRSTFLILALIVFLSTVNFAFAEKEIVWDENGVAIRQGYHIEWQRAGAIDEDGYVLYIWSDTRESERNVYAQLFAPDGTQEWGDEGNVIVAAPIRQEDPDVIADGFGNFLVSWVDYRADEWGDVWAQKIDRNGNQLWSPQGVPLCTVDTTMATNPFSLTLHTMPDGLGGAIVVWNDGRSGDDGDLYAHHVLENGQVDPQWPVNGLLVAGGSGGQGGPGNQTVDSDGNGGVWVGYTDTRVSGDPNIYLQHVDRDGNLMTPYNVGIPIAIVPDYQENVKLAPDSVGSDVEAIVSSMNERDVVLLENLRYHKEETENDPGFSRQLAALADVYINDAFGTAHRAHASTEGITNFIDTVGCGYLLKKEIDFLCNAVENPKRPFVAIIGGAKISGKIEVITTLLDKADVLLIGGAMTFTFFKAMSLEIGKSLLEEDKVDLAGEIIRKGETSPCEFLLPVDCMVADTFDRSAEIKYVDWDDIPADWLSPDIGPKTCDLYASKIKGAGTVLWNGPMGAFEIEKFAAGTMAIADAMADATKEGAITIVGGGDSAAAIAKFEMEDLISHISTGGGASLELLEGKVLPGVKALDR